MQTDLLSKTLDKLRDDARTINEIADGAGVNRHWLAKLKQGKFDNPGVRTIERLHNFLCGNPSLRSGADRRSA